MPARCDDRSFNDEDSRPRVRGAKLLNAPFKAAEEEQDDDHNWQLFKAAAVSNMPIIEENQAVEIPSQLLMAPTTETAEEAAAASELNSLIEG